MMDENKTELVNKTEMIEATQSEILKHLNQPNMVVEVATGLTTGLNGTKKRAKCVDGGYRENEAVGAEAFPGGDKGLCMILMALGVSPEQAFNWVYEFVTTIEGRPFCWHTDLHENPDHGVEVGCGHCNLAITHADRYHVTEAGVHQLLNLIRQKQGVLPVGQAGVFENSDSQMECVVLDREHMEKAILVVTGETHTVKPWDQALKSQYFIYNQTLHQRLLGRLSDFLITQKQQNAEEFSQEKLWQMANKHTDATLGLLKTSRGQMMFKVDVDVDKREVKYLQDAPAY